MRKSIYLAALAALTLSACSNEQDMIFDDSAAVRLEQYKQKYAEALTAEGGLWSMEYFSNPDEPGYVFVMKFGKGNDVTISANHKWIGGEFKQETSLWKMIADNGPVLSFNSYNSLFHIFSDPANIVGPDAPTGESGDINETGFGHEGDYEFQVMDVSEDGNVIRLLGKKRLLNGYLRRLDPSTDVKVYMDEYKQLESSLFCKEISTLILKNFDGENYIVKDAHTGVMSIYPEAGDPVDQTRTSNFIITNSGIRFMEPFEIVNAAGEEKTISELKFVNNHSLALVDNENAILNAGTFVDVLNLNHPNWKMNVKTLTGDLKTAFDKLTAQLKDLYSYKTAAVQSVSLSYDTQNKSYKLVFTLKTGPKDTEADSYYVSFEDTDENVKMILDGPCTANDQAALNVYTELKNILELMTSGPISYKYLSDCGPKSVSFQFGNSSFDFSAIAAK